MLQHGRPGGKGFWWPKKWDELDSSCITDGGNIPGKDSFLFLQNWSKSNLKMSKHRLQQALFKSKTELGLVSWPAGMELMQFKFITQSRIYGKNLGRKYHHAVPQIIKFQDTQSRLCSHEQAIRWCWWQASKERERCIQVQMCMIRQSFPGYSSLDRQP